MFVCVCLVLTAEGLPGLSLCNGLTVAVYRQKFSAFSLSVGRQSLVCRLSGHCCGYLGRVSHINGVPVSVCFRSSGRSLHLQKCAQLLDLCHPQPAHDASLGSLAAHAFWPRCLLDSKQASGQTHCITSGFVCWPISMLWGPGGLLWPRSPGGFLMCHSPASPGQYGCSNYNVAQETLCTAHVLSCS